MQNTQQSKPVAPNFLRQILQKTRVKQGSVLDLLLVPITGTIAFILLSQSILQGVVTFIAGLISLAMFGFNSSTAIEAITYFLIIFFTGLGVWAFLSLLKTRTYFIAFIGVALALLLRAILSHYIADSDAVLVSGMCGAFVLFAASNLMSNAIPNQAVLMVAACMIVVGSSVAQPIIIQKTDERASVKTVSGWFNAGKEKINFKIYYPTYQPTSTNPTRPMLYDYDAAMQGKDYPYTNLYVGFDIGQLHVTESSPIRNQAAILGSSGSCDLATLVHDMAIGFVSEKDVQNSQAEPHPCAYLGSSADPIYKSFDNSVGDRSTYYYKQVDGTDIVIENDTAYKNKLPESIAIDSEVQKIFASVQEIPKDQLIKSGPDSYLDCHESCN